jgi:hypothetical protein
MKRAARRPEQVEREPLAFIESIKRRMYDDAL